MAYGPTEIGIQQDEQRPYGEGVRALQLEQARKDAQTFSSPAKPSAGPRPAAMAPINPGQPMAQAEAAPDPQHPEYEPLVLGGIARATDWLSRGFSNALGAVPGPNGEMPLLGAKGPTDRTNAQDFLPSIARGLLDAFVDPAERAGAEGAAGKPIDTLTVQHQKERAAELQTQYGDSMDEATSMRIAQLEETYNRLGGALIIEAAIVTGFTPVGVAAAAGLTGASVVGALQADADAAGRSSTGSAERIARGEQRLPKESVGRAVVENAMPELSVLQPLRIAYNASMLKLGLTRVAGTAEDVVKATGEASEALRSVEAAADTVAAKGGAATNEAEAIADMARVDRAALGPEPAGVGGAAGEAPGLGVVATPPPVNAEEEVIAAATRTIEREGTSLQEQLQSLGPIIQKAMGQQIQRVTAALARAYDVDFLKKKYGEDWQAFYGVHSFETIDDAISALQRTADEHHIAIPASLLGRLGAARAAAENVTIQSKARRAIWEGEVVIARDAKTATKKTAATAKSAAATAAEKVESGTEKLARAEERLKRVKQDAEQAQRLRYQQDVSAAAGEVEKAADGTAPDAVAKAAAPKIEAEGAEVTAAADAERARLARRASSTATKVWNSATDIISRVQARMDEVNKRIEGRNRNISSIKGDEEPKIGYVSVDDENAWAQARLHTGKFDWGHDVRQAMVDFVAVHGEEIEQALTSGRVSLYTLTTSLAKRTGAAQKDLERTIKSVYGGDHKVLRTFYVADEVLGNKMREWHDAGVLFSEGKITADQLDVVSSDLLDFQKSISLGKGEIGRILSSFRLQKNETAAGLRLATQKVKITYGELELAAKKLDALAGNVADASEGAARAQTRIDELEEQSLALVKQIEDETKAGLEGQIVMAERAAAEERLTEARAALQKIKNQQRTLSDGAVAKIQAAQKAFDDASAAMKPLEDAADAATDAAAVATDAARKSYVEWASKIKMKPEDLRALSYIDPNDTERVIRMFRDATPSSWGERLTTYLLNATYGAVQGLEQNFLFDILVLARQEGFAQIVPNTTGKIAEKIVGTKLFDASVERAAQYGAFNEAAADAWQMFSKIMMQGEDPEGALKYGMQNIEQLIGGSGGRRPIVPGAKVAAIPVEGLLRLLNGPDAATRVFATSFEQRRLAAFLGAQEGGLQGAVERLAKLSAGDPEVTAEAARMAARMTTNDVLNPNGNLAKVLHAINIDYKDFRPGAVLIPAARWGFAYQRNSMRALGAGLFTGYAKARRARGLSGDERIFVGREAARDMAEGTMGAMLMASGAVMLNAGLLTGAEPDDEEGKRQWKEQKKQAGSVKIAGNWVPLVALGPIGVPLAVVAMVGDQTNAKDEWTATDRMGRAAQLMGRYITDVPAFTGTYRLFDSIYSSARYGWGEGSTRFVALQASRVVPAGGFLNSLVPVFDKYQRSPEDFLQMLAARLPFVSQIVPAVKRFGEEQERPVSGPAVFNPLGAAQQQPLSPASQALADNDITWTGELVSLGKQDTTDKEKRLFEATSGPLVKEWAEAAIASDIYRAEPSPIKRQDIMNKIVSQARSYGREVVAYESLKAARTPQEVSRAAKMMRSVSSLWDYTTHLEALAEDGRLTAEVAAALDMDRGMLGGEEAPTVQQILQTAPAVRQYLSIPPFTRGTPAEWSQYDAALAEASRIEKTFGPQEADYFRRTNPIIRMLSGSSNPQRARFLDRNPKVKPFVSGLRHQGDS